MLLLWACQCSDTVLTQQVAIGRGVWEKWVRRTGASMGRYSERQGTLCLTGTGGRQGTLAFENVQSVARHVTVTQVDAPARMMSFRRGSRVLVLPLLCILESSRAAGRQPMVHQSLTAVCSSRWRLAFVLCPGVRDRPSRAWGQD